MTSPTSPTSPISPTSPTSPASPDSSTPPSDPVLVKRAAIAQWVSRGQRVGYGAFLLASIAFAQTVIWSPTSIAVNIIVVCLAAGSTVLLPAIIFGYAVKAAVRHDRALAAEAAAKKAVANKRRCDQ